MGRAEILGRERRRTWSDEDKLRILAEAREPEVSLASVARRHDLCPQQLYAWRRLFREAAEARAETPVVFLPVEVSDASTRPAAPRSRRRTKAVEVTLVGGRRLRVDPDIDPDTLCRLVQALERA
jgi:transposase